MNEEQMQQPNMTPDEAAASLSFATMLSEGMMPKALSPTEEDGEMPMEIETPTEEGTEEIPEEKGKNDMMELDTMMKEHMEEMDKKMDEKMDKMVTEMKSMMEKMMKKE